MRLSQNENEPNEKDVRKKLRICAQKYLNLQTNKHKLSCYVMKGFYSKVSLAVNWARPSNEKNNEGFLARSDIPLIFSSFFKNSSGCFTK